MTLAQLARLSIANLLLSVVFGVAFGSLAGTSFMTICAFLIFLGTLRREGHAHE